MKTIGTEGALELHARLVCELLTVNVIVMDREAARRRTTWKEDVKHLVGPSAKSGLALICAPALLGSSACNQLLVLSVSSI